MRSCFASVPFHVTLASWQVVSCHSPFCVSLVYEDREPTKLAQRARKTARPLLVCTMVCHEAREMAKCE